MCEVLRSSILNLMFDLGGEVHDRNDNLLAGKGEVIVVGLHPARIEDREALPDKVAELLSLEVDYINRQIDRYSNPEWFVELKRLTESKFDSIREDLLSIPGLTFRKQTIDRLYPYPELTAHLVGYMGEVDLDWISTYLNHDYRSGDRIGRAGIEKAFEFQLRGEPGYRLYIQGFDQETGEMKSRDLIMEKAAVSGVDIHLSIDIELQEAGYQAMADKLGSIVLMDPWSGEVLVMLSQPSYDPNEFLLGISRGRLRELQSDENTPMINRAIQGLYPPGSTMKIFTSAAAIDSGIVDTDTVFYDNGEYKVQGNVIRNYQREIFGEHQLKEAMKHSINTTMAKIGIELGRERFLEYGERFSFNQRRDFPLAIRVSSLGSLNSPVDLAWSAIGQAEVLVTPLEMAVLSSVIAANGRQVNPSLLRSSNIEDIIIDSSYEDEINDDYNIHGNEFIQDNIPVDNILEDKLMEDVFQLQREVEFCQLIKPETAEFLSDFMVSVVEGGTGREASVEGIDIAGKTGTAEIGGSDNATHAWFTSFAPAENPEYVLLVFLERGGVGGQNAAPIAGQLWQHILRVGVEPQTGDSSVFGEAE